MESLQYDAKAVLLAMNTISNNVSAFNVAVANFQNTLHRWREQKAAQAAREASLNAREQAIAKEEGRLLVLRDELVSEKAEFLRRSQGV
jgi:hypothetical protein